MRSLLLQRPSFGIVLLACSLCLLAGIPASAQTTSLSFNNSSSDILSVLSSEGLIAGDQVDELGNVVGGLTLDTSTSATYSNDGADALRATLELDGGRDLYRFEGTSECAGLVVVSFKNRSDNPLQVRDARIVAATQSSQGIYLGQAVTTVTTPTTEEQLLVRGAGSVQLDVRFALGSDGRGRLATFTQRIDTQVACDQVTRLDVRAGDTAATIGLSDVVPATGSEQLPVRREARSLLDAELSNGADTQKSAGPSLSSVTLGSTTKANGDGTTSFCTDETFDGTDLPNIWGFDLIGDALIGSAGLTGTGRLTLTGTGTSLYHGTDNGGYVYRSVGGDFRAEVTLMDVPVNQGGDFRKSGLMVRESLDPNAARVMVQLVVDHPVYNTTALQFDFRNKAGDALELASTPVDLGLPLRIAVDRRGDVFTAYYSTDNGNSWIKPLGGVGQGQIEIDMGSASLVGMTATSYDNALPLTVEYDDFRLCTPNNDPAPNLPPAISCLAPQKLDLYYVVDSSGSMTAAFPGATSKLAAVADAIASANTLLGTNFPGSRAALVTYRGAVFSDPVFNVTQGAQVATNLTTDLTASTNAIAAIDPTQIHPDANTPAPIALDLTTQDLVNTNAPDFLPVVVWLTDGAPNIDINGHGPLEYRFTEILPLSIRDTNNDFLPFGQVAWLGNYNGGINTYDGKVFADTMFQIENLKDTVTDALIYPVAIRGEDTFYEDLMAYAAAYTGTQLFTVDDTDGLAAAIADILTVLDCGATIGDYVWNDLNGDGVQDGSESGIAGVTVELRDDQGTVVATDVTDANGEYLFENVVPGTYTVTVDPSSLPAGVSIPTYDLDGTATPNEASVTVAEGDERLDVDFGYQPAASIGDYVWLDANGDGVQDGSESGIAGVTVELRDDQGTVIATATTGANGEYLFGDLVAGTYTVTVDPSSLPAGVSIPTYDLDGTATPNEASVTVAVGDERLDVDFGYQATASIGDRVWNDTNGDGVQDGDENGIAGVTVELRDDQGTVIATATTGSDGEYLFDNLVPGTYTVTVDDSTLPADANDPTFDFDGTATPHTASVTVASGESQLDVDFGYDSADGGGGDTCVEGTYRDDFNVASFSNQDGSLDWSGDWVEDDPIAAGVGDGQVQVHDGFLTLDDAPDTGAQPSAERSADLSHADGATLSFSFATSRGVDYSDAVTVEISSDGGATWSVLEVMDGIEGSTTGERSYDISAFISEDTRVRFRVSNKYGGSNELFCIDWIEIVTTCDVACEGEVQARDDFNVASFSNQDGATDWAGDWIEFDPTVDGVAGGQVQVHDGYLTLNDAPNTGYHPSAERAIDLSGKSNVTMSFAFATSNGVDYNDKVTVEISSDGGATWTTLEVIGGIEGAVEDERSYDISEFASADTRIRFRVSKKYGGSNELFCIDWIEIVADCDDDTGNGGGNSYPGDHYEGELTCNDDSNFQPDGSYYWSESGVHEGWLEGEGEDFDLYLYRWDGRRWRKVAQSISETSSEHISYNGSAGYYTWEVRSYRGHGSYDVWISQP